MNNNLPCGQCRHFDQQTVYRGPARKPARYGWCKKLSVYPAQEWDPARPFDLDVVRGEEGAHRSSPKIQFANSVVKSCIYAEKK